MPKALAPTPLAPAPWGMAFSRFTINNNAMEVELFGPGGQVYRYIESLAEDVRRSARAFAPNNTGALARSLQISMDREVQRRITAHIFTNVEYAIYQEKGTGTFVGRPPIQPRQAKVLVFTPRGSNNPVFAMYTRGTPPTHFMEKGLKFGQPYPVRNLSNGRFA